MREKPPDTASTRLQAGKAATMLAFHLAALLAPWCFTWEGLAVFLVLAAAVGQLGLSMGYHRLICHRGYRTAGLPRSLLALFGVLAFQGGPLTWSAIHRLHHRHADRDEDPQASHRPAWHAYLLWALASEMPGLATPGDFERVTRDLRSDRVLRLLERWQYALHAALALGLCLAGWAADGWALSLSLLVWGFVLRVAVGWHTAFLVNLLSHRTGYRNYDTADNSRNCWWVALLTFGEGWHNNHHHQPRSAAHGHRWFEVDTSYLLIRGLELAGLASNVVRPQRSC